MALTPDGATLVVADRLSDAVSLVDTRTLKETARIEVGTHPFGVTLDTKGRRAYTADVESDSVTVIDMPSRQVAGTIRVGKHPYVVALAGNRGFSTDELASTVTAFDLTSLLWSARSMSDDYPEGIEAGADGRLLYVANWFSDSMSVIDAQSLAVVATLPAGSSPRAFGTFIR